MSKYYRNIYRDFMSEHLMILVASISEERGHLFFNA